MKKLKIRLREDVTEGVFYKKTFAISKESLGAEIIYDIITLKNTTMSGYYQNGNLYVNVKAKYADGKPTEIYLGYDEDTKLIWNIEE